MADDRAWSALIRDARAGSCRLAPPTEFFNDLERRSVLFLNTSLTLSVVARDRAPKECYGHFPLWAPLLVQLLSFLAGRQYGHVVFLLFGRHAENVFDRYVSEVAARRGAARQTRAAVVRHCHPAAITREGPAFLKPPDPLRAANKELRRMGAEPAFGD